MQDTRPSNQGTNPIKTKSPDKYKSVPVMAKDPIRMAEGSEWICAEIRSLKTGGPRASDAKCILEVLVQCIEKAVRESLFGLLAMLKEDRAGLTQRKKRIVTRQSGYIDCFSVNSAAVVLSSSLTFSKRFLKKPILKKQITEGN